MNRKITDCVRFGPRLLVSFLLLSGCNIFDDGKSKVVEITPEFNVDIFEELGQVRQFQIIASSIEDQDCENYSIDSHSQRSSKSIRISLNDIVFPENCIPGNAPAKSVIPLGFLANDNNYIFQINLKNTIFNNGMLSVTDRAYVLSMETKDGIVLMRSELLRVPQHVIWGYIGFDDAGAVADAPANFISDLENLTVPQDFEEGYYGHYSIERNNKLSFPTQLDFQHLKTFIYHFEGTDVDLENLLQSFRGSPAGPFMEIKLFNSAGEVF